MSAPLATVAEPTAEPNAALEPTRISCRNTAAQALTIVRDGVITGEGPTTKGRVHFSREIDDAAAERSDDGRFDDLLAKAVVHHAASESGLPVPPRTVALSPDTSIESWAPTRAAGVDIEVLEWIAARMRGKRRSNRTLMRLVATIVGVAALPLVQLPRVFDIGM
jgi:hypothetical protein